jgi:O-antigen/teichoic acid export membrane protein
MVDPKLNVGRQLFRNAMAGWLEMAILLTYALIGPPLLLNRIGKEGYGVWTLVGQVIAYLSIMDLGVSSSVGRFVAKYSARDDRERVSAIVSSSLFLFLVFGAAILLIAALISPYFSVFFALGTEYSGLGGRLVFLTGLGLAVSLPLRIGRGMLEGSHRFDTMYLARGLEPVVKLLLVVIIFGLAGSRNLLLLAVIAIVAMTLPDLVMCRMARRRRPYVSLRLRYVTRGTLREIWSLSLSALLVTVASLFLHQGQILAVGKIAGVSEVILFALPCVLLRYGSMVVSYVVAAFKPLASHVHSRGDQDALRELNIMGVRYSVMICLFVGVMSILFGRPVFQVWLSSGGLSERDFVTLANVLTILALGFLVGIPQEVTAKMLAGTGRHWFSATALVITSLTGFLLGVILARQTSLGIYGVALGWSFTYLIQGLAVFPVSACRVFGIRPLSYVRQAYSRPLTGGLIWACLAYGVRLTVGTESRLSLLACLLTCGIVYLVIAYFFCLDARERAHVAGLLHRAQARFRGSLLCE